MKKCQKKSGKNGKNNSPTIGFPAPSDRTPWYGETKTKLTDQQWGQMGYRLDQKKIITFIPGRAGNIQNVRKRLYLFQKFNQCNLHHSPHTGDLEKKIKKKKVQSFSDILYIFKASIPALQCTQHHNVYRKFPKVKAVRAWNWPLPPSSAKLNLLAPELFFFKF